jgi:hypothetical protein
LTKQIDQYLTKLLVRAAAVVTAETLVRQNPQDPKQHLAATMRQNRLSNRIFKSLRRRRRSLLLRLEHADRPALENHVSRTPRLEPSVIQSED